MHSVENPRKNPGKRYSLTVTGLYVSVLEALVEEGVYMDVQDGLRSALRLLFEHHEIRAYLDLIREVKKTYEEANESL